MITEPAGPTAMTSLQMGGLTATSAVFEGGEHRITIDDPTLSHDWTYQVVGRLIGGRVRITALSIAQRSGNQLNVTTEVLRKAPINLLRDRLRAALTTQWEDRVAILAALARTHLPKDGHSRTTEHFLHVAWFYSHAQMMGNPPRRAVQEHWSVHPVTASRWIRRARDLGYLPKYDLATMRAAEAGSGQSAHLQATDQISVAITRQTLARVLGEESPTFRELVRLIDEHIKT